MPHQSVSLRHTPTKRSPLRHSSQDAQPSNNSGDSAKAAVCSSSERDHSGESSNADNWFETSNNARRTRTSLIDSTSNAFRSRILHSANDVKDEPPMFLKNPSSESALESQAIPPSSYYPLPFRSGMAPLQSNESSSDDYRSVIDDLTIENKLLKRQLKKYERLNDPHIHSDRLFEVRIHGLSASKKQELESLLGQFAMGLNSPSPVAQSKTASRPLAPHLGISKPTSSRTSTRVADSGYGSLAASNQAYANQTPSSPSSRPNHVASNIESSTTARDQSIQSYLHHIPEGLLPRQSPAVMSEDERKRLVVSKLEQIFCGRGAAAEGHQQPIQQQEVSQCAARDEVYAIEARGQKALPEGTREAPIMSVEAADQPESDNPSNQPTDHEMPTAPRKSLYNNKVGEHDFATRPDPVTEQRPTRPLDLDPNRAQVPADNIQYIRHLGFTLSNDDDLTSAVDHGGWVYLNLLFNMAQMHTLNVTTDFVKQAVTDRSSNLELSRDGRKIRWRDTSDAGGTFDRLDGYTTRTSHYHDGQVKTRARFASQQDANDFRWEPSHAAKKQMTSRNGSKPFAYTPMFAHESSEDAQMADDEYATTSPMPEDTGDSSAFPNTSKPRVSTTTPLSDGPMVFYNNASFFTDLSGDISKVSRSTKSMGIHPASSVPLGVPESEKGSRKLLSDESPPLKPTESPLCMTDIDDCAMDVDCSPSDLQVYGHEQSRHRVAFDETSNPRPFEASGIGGVWPSDNFAVFVTRRHQLEMSNSPRPSLQFAEFELSAATGAPMSHVAEEVISAKFHGLEASALPPPSFAFSPDTTGSEITSDDSDEHAISRKPLTQQDVPCDAPSDASSSEDGDVDSMTSENESQLASNGSQMHETDDQSVDFLAAARAADPATIRKREREYDAELAERLAEEIPAGSSAATCGGGVGSGFNSPADYQHVNGQGKRRNKTADRSISS